jgi:ubiquinone/menaquinone biosynthesis C-methylase UbiE
VEVRLKLDTLSNRHRRGYPPAFVDVLAQALPLAAGDVAADVGCGTGQLTIPLARHVRAVVGMDPEPAMLALAGQAAAGQGLANVTWVMGGDSDLPALSALLGEQALTAVTIANAIHLMAHERLFAAALRILRPGGGLAVIANGTPLWQQPSDWSQVLRHALEQWLGTTLESHCGTDQPSRQRYHAALHEAGFTDIHEESAGYASDLSFDEVIGGIYSAMPSHLLPPPDQRAAFTGHPLPRAEAIRWARPGSSATLRGRDDHTGRATSQPVTQTAHRGPLHPGPDTPESA